MMNKYGKSDSSIVPEKLPNKACKKAAEAMEESGLAKGNTFKQNAYRTRCRKHAQSALKRVRRAAIGGRKLRFTAQTTDWYFSIGRQDRSAGNNGSYECDLRTGFSRIFLWVSTRTQSTSCFGRTLCWNHEEKGELGA